MSSVYILNVCIKLLVELSTIVMIPEQPVFELQKETDDRVVRTGVSVT